MTKLKRILSLFLIAVFLFSIQVFAQDSKAERFGDVPEGHWADKAVHDLRLIKITDGIGNNRFGMGLTIKRSEFTAFLVKLMKWELIKPEKGSFIDNLDSGKWYYSQIETALEHGVVIKDVDRFRPDEPITREEMAVMIVRTLGYDSLARQLTYLGSPFADVSENTGYITIAKDFGIIAGVGNNQFMPRATAKREEAAVMMMKMYEKLGRSINELHAFYAISSANQADKLSALDSVGFGWSRLEYDSETSSVFLNTTDKNGNEYDIPEGFTKPLNSARENNVSTQLMVYANNDTVFSTAAQSKVHLVEYIITRPEVRRQVIEAITSQINNEDLGNTSPSFDGVVIDFESMKGDMLRQSFNIFLKELKQELNKSNKLLYVAVHPKRRPGQAYYDGYDYRTIGETADKVILMAHDYYAKQLTEAEMHNGYTTTPLAPIDEVYYALKSITDKDTGVKDLNRIWIQFSFDSAQWKLKEGKVINKYPYNPGYEAIQKRLLMEGVEVNYQETSLSPYAAFYDAKDETDNIIWYEDSRSIRAKISLAKMFGIEGISLWRLGNIPDYEDTQAKRLYLDVWQQIMNNKLK